VWRVCLINGRVYGYGETQAAAWQDFRAQISGADGRMKQWMKQNAVAVPLTDDKASEVAEMVATPW